MTPPSPPSGSPAPPPGRAAAARARPLARDLGHDAVDRLRRRTSPTPSTWSPGTCPATATTAPCPRSRSRWPSWPPACSRSWTTLLAERGESGGSFAYAGDSVGGAVGLQLLLDAPDRVESAVLLCTGAKIGDPDMWADRIGQVSASGTPAMVVGFAERWFGPGFLDREPERGSALLHALQDTDDQGYIQVCRALAEFDVRDRLAEIDAPVLAVAGADDGATPTERAARDRRGRAARPARRARRGGPPRARRGARGGRPADPRPRPRRGRSNARHDVRRGHGGAPRGAR